MQYCKKCGTQLTDEAEFCHKCGTPISGGIHIPEPKGSRTECFGWERAGEPWGIVAVGIFIIGIAILWIFDAWWPGFLFLIAIMILVGAIISYYARRPRETHSSRIK
jgi:hypothetical protein